MNGRRSTIDWRADRLLVVAVTALWASLLLLYTVLTPVWRSPDESKHFDLVLDIADGRGYSAWDDDLLLQSVVTAGESVVAMPPGVPIARDGTPPGIRNVTDDGTMSVERNHMSQHPPGYYELVGRELDGLRALGLARDSVSGQLAQTRGLSAVLLVPIPLLCWLVTRQLGLRRGVQRLALAVPFLVPGLAEVAGGVSNDAALVLLFSGLAAVLAAYATGGRARRLVVAMGVICGLALLTKAFAGAAVVWTVVVILAGVRETGRRRAAVDSLIFLGLAGAIGGWWYVRNLIVDGRLLPSIEEMRFNGSPYADVYTGVQVWSERFWPVAGRGFFGLFGFAELSVSDLVYRMVLLVAVVVIGVGVATVRRGRGPLLLLVTPLPVLLVLQVSQSYRLYQSSGIVALGHGRYLLPAIVPCAVLAAVGAHRLGRGSRWLLGGAFLLAIALHLHLMGRLSRFFWSPRGGLAGLDVAFDWSPLGTGAPAALGFVTLSLTLVVLGIIAWTSWSLSPAGELDGDEG